MGRAIDIEGLSATRTDVLARIEWSGGTSQAIRRSPEQTSFVAQAAPGALALSKTYLVLGVEHITLAAATLGLVHVAQAPVEATLGYASECPLRPRTTGR